jgi:hypothetical protein
MHAYDHDQLVLHYTERKKNQLTRSIIMQMKYLLVKHNNNENNKNIA